MMLLLLLMVMMWDTGYGMRDSPLMGLTRGRHQVGASRTGFEIARVLLTRPNKPSALAMFVLIGRYCCLAATTVPRGSLRSASASVMTTLEELPLTSTTKRGLQWSRFCQRKPRWSQARLCLLSLTLGFLANANGNCKYQGTSNYL